MLFTFILNVCAVVGSGKTLWLPTGVVNVTPLFITPEMLFTVDLKSPPKQVLHTKLCFQREGKVRHWNYLKRSLALYQKGNHLLAR